MPKKPMKIEDLEKPTETESDQRDIKFQFDYSICRPELNNLKKRVERLEKKIGIS